MTKMKRVRSNLKSTQYNSGCELVNRSSSSFESNWRVYLIFLAPMILLPLTWGTFEEFGVNTNSEIRVQFQTYLILLPFIFIFYANHQLLPLIMPRTIVFQQIMGVVYLGFGFGLLMAYIQLQLAPNLQIVNDSLDPVVSLFMFALGTYLFCKPIADAFRMSLNINQDEDQSKEDAQILDWSSKTQQIISTKLIIETDVKDTEERFFVQMRELIGILGKDSYLRRPDFLELRDRNNMKTKQLYKRLRSNYGWPENGEAYSQAFSDLRSYYERKHSIVDLDEFVKTTMSASNETNGVFVKSKGELFRFLYILTETKPESAYSNSPVNDLLGMFISPTTTKQTKKSIQKKIGLILAILAGLWKNRYSDLDIEGSFTRSFSADAYDLFVDLSNELGLRDHKLTFHEVFSPDNLEDLISSKWTSVSEIMQIYIQATRDTFKIARPSEPDLIQKVHGTSEYLQNLKAELVEKFNATYE